MKEKPTLADFFDFKKYPGKRLMRKDSQAMYEMALMADGVPKDKLYPLDVPRALKKIAAIKKDLLFWGTGAESQSMLRDGEVVMGWLWNTRATLLQRDTNKQVTFSFDGGLLQPGLWIVPEGQSGRQAGDGRAIASMQEPEGQVKLLAAMGNGPANPAAAAAGAGRAEGDRSGVARQRQASRPRSTPTGTRRTTPRRARNSST